MTEKKRERNLLQQQRLQVVNIGLDLFAQALQKQQAPVVHVDWKPPAAGDKELMNMLDQLL
jgi:FdrA protein